MASNDNADFASDINPNALPTTYRSAGSDLLDMSLEQLLNIKASIVDLFIQDKQSITESINIAAGFRYDWYNDFGHALSPRIVAVASLPSQDVYVLLGAKLAYNLTPAFKFTINISNILNERIRTASSVLSDGVPNRGRLILLGLVYHL